MKAQLIAQRGVLRNGDLGDFTRFALRALFPDRTLFADRSDGALLAAYTLFPPKAFRPRRSDRPLYGHIRSARVRLTAAVSFVRPGVIIRKTAPPCKCRILLVHRMQEGAYSYPPCQARQFIFCYSKCIKQPRPGRNSEDSFGCVLLSEYSLTENLLEQSVPHSGLKVMHHPRKHMQAQKDPQKAERIVKRRLCTALIEPFAKGDCPVVYFPRDDRE